MTRNLLLRELTRTFQDHLTSILVLCDLAVVLPVKVPLVHDGTTGVVKERQGAMKSIERTLRAPKTALDAVQTLN